MNTNERSEPKAYGTVNFNDIPLNYEQVSRHLELTQVASKMLCLLRNEKVIGMGEVAFVLRQMDALSRG